MWPALILPGGDWPQVWGALFRVAAWTFLVPAVVLHLDFWGILPASWGHFEIVMDNVCRFGHLLGIPCAILAFILGARWGGALAIIAHLLLLVLTPTFGLA